MPGCFAHALPRGKEAGDVGEDRMMRAVGRQHGEKRVGVLSDLAAAQFQRQDLAQRRVGVAAGTEAVVAAEHDQRRPPPESA